MGKVKGYLKKASGTLKSHMLGITLATTCLSAVGAITAFIGMVTTRVTLDKDYKNSDVYQNYIHEQYMDLEEKYNSGEYSLGEYMQKVETLEDNGNVDEFIKLDLEGNEEFQARLKTVDKWTTSTIALASILGGGGLVPMVSSAILGTKIAESAKRDLEAAKAELNGASSTKKRRKSRNSDKFGISDEEELKSIDEYYTE